MTGNDLKRRDNNDCNKMAGKKIVKRIKQSLSLGSRSPSPQPDPSGSTGGAASTSIGYTSLAKFLEKELKEAYHKLVAPFLGYKQKVKAVELLLKRFPETKPVVFSQTGKNKTGRKKNSYMISFDEFEEPSLPAPHW